MNHRKLVNSGEGGARGGRLRSIAFFDFDNTLIKGDSQGIELSYLRRKRRISLSFMSQLGVKHLLFRRGFYGAEEMVRECIAGYRGIYRSTLQDDAPHFYREEIKPRLLRKMLTRVEDHRSRGDTLVLLSASVPHIIKEAARDLDFDIFFSTKLEEDEQGRLTGRPDGPICMGQRKQHFALKFARESGIELKSCFAYSDHHADLPLLEIVGNPVAVRPTRRLARLAKIRNWPIVMP